MIKYDTTVISSNAFGNDKVLKTVKANSILSIENEAFSGCTNLEDIQISNCEIIKSKAFQNCSSLKSVDGNKVKSIGSFAFENDVQLCSYDFSECSSIGDGAFKIDGSYNANLKYRNMNFPRCKYIGDEAFSYNCDKLGYPYNTLTAIDFKECEEIGDNAFSITNHGDTYSTPYRNVSSLNFPRCRKIGNGAFSTKGNDSNTQVNTFIRNLSTIYFPECSSIGDEAFYSHMKEQFSREAHLKNIRFPKCKVIGSRAFKTKSVDSDEYKHYVNLTSLDFTSCENVNDEAFYQFIVTNNIDFNLSSCLSLGNGVFNGSNFLSSINLDNCKHIGDGNLYNCTATIKEINLPNIESIGISNFSKIDDNKLTSINFGRNLSSFGIRNFESIKYTPVKLSIEESNPYFEINERSNMIYSLSSTDKKGKGLIEAYLLTSNYFDDDMDYIREYAGYNCQQILSVKSVQCKTIERYAFYECNNLTSITFDSVSSVGEYAFYNAGGDNGLLNTIYLPECLRIGTFAFANKKATIKSTPAISLPKCQYIGKYAFSYNTNAVESYNTFTQVLIPSCLSIGYRAFTDHGTPTELTVKLGNTIPKLINDSGTCIEATSTNITSYIIKNANILVPEAMEESYKKAFGSTNYTFMTYVDDENPLYEGYYYKGDVPKTGDATILKISDEAKVITENAEIPTTISAN